MSGSSHIAGLDLAIPSARGFKGQSIANFDLVWINSCGLQVINVQKHIWAAVVVFDEAETPVGIPHFQLAGGHPISPSPSARLAPWPA
jgi:hypothetical protein